MKSEDFISVPELLGHFRGQPMSTIFQSSVAYPENCWRIRNSGVWGRPDNSAETFAIELACEALRIELKRTWSATPINPDSFRMEGHFLDGGISCMTGDYWFYEKGGWVAGPKCVLLLCLKLGLRVRESWLRKFDVLGMDLEDLRSELRNRSEPSDVLDSIPSIFRKSE